MYEEFFELLYKLKNLRFLFEFQVENNILNVSSKGKYIPAPQ